MPTECNPELFDFARADGRAVVASFDGGAITSDAGALLLGATDRVLGLTRRLAACFKDSRNPAYTEHAVETLVMQRVVSLALGYEDLNDHDQLRHDPVLATLAGKLAATREDCAPLAGKSTLNRLEPSREEPDRYARIAADTAAIEALFVDLFLDAHAKAPAQITLDLDATDDPLHGHQEGRFFHGYYDCYCYLPLYIFCGRHLLAAKLRRSNIDGAAGAVEEVARIVSQIRARWPRVRIWLRADSGFCREALMAWCEANRVDYIFGLARNPRLTAEIETEMAAARAAAEKTGKPARRFKDFRWSTLDSWSRIRRVIGKAEWTEGSAPISCGSTPELRDGLKCLEQVGDAPQAAGEPRRHAAQDVLRSLLRVFAFGGRGVVDGIPLSGGDGEVERERHDQDQPGQPVWISDLAVFEAEAARFEVREHRLDAPPPSIVKRAEIARSLGHGDDPGLLVAGILDHADVCAHPTCGQIHPRQVGRAPGQLLDRPRISTVEP
jgi:hypothetical protein